MNFETIKNRADFLHAKGGARWVTPGFTLQARAQKVVARQAHSQNIANQNASSQAPNDHKGRNSGDHDKAKLMADMAGDSGARVGFTVTKRIGNAVMRNRIKRRFREIVSENSGLLAKSKIDYVLIARHGAEMRGFDDLKKDFQLALKRVHGKLRQKSGKAQRPAKPSP